MEGDTRMKHHYDLVVHVDLNDAHIFGLALNNITNYMNALDFLKGEGQKLVQFKFIIISFFAYASTVNCSHWLLWNLIMK